MDDKPKTNIIIVRKCILCWIRMTVITVDSKGSPSIRFVVVVSLLFENVFDVSKNKYNST